MTTELADTLIAGLLLAYTSGWVAQTINLWERRNVLLPME